MQKKTWGQLVIFFAVLVMATAFSVFISLKTNTGYPYVKLIEKSQFVTYNSNDEVTDHDTYTAIFNVDQSFGDTINALRSELGMKILSESEKADYTILKLEGDSLIIVYPKTASLEIESTGHSSRPAKYTFEKDRCSLAVLWTDPLPSSIRQFIGIKLPHQ